MKDGGYSEEADMRYESRSQLFRGRPKNATMQGAIVKNVRLAPDSWYVDTKGPSSVKSTCAKGENLAVILSLGWQLTAL